MPDPPALRLADLPLGELTDLLEAAFRQDQGEAEDGPDPATRAALADDLGCHEEVRAAVWQMWRCRLKHDRAVKPGHVEYWLDAEFVEPCPRS